MNSLLRLEQLRDHDQPQVGTPLVCLSQALRQGDAVQRGAVVPHALMQTIWSAITGLDRILQNFPHLELRFLPHQPAQVQDMAQSLQSKILAQPLPAPWHSVWQSQIQQWDAQFLWLTAYLWMADDDTKPAAALMLHPPPRGCQPQVEALAQGLKGLWAELFQAQRLHILQHLELRPDQLRMSVLVQPLPNVQAMGWLKLGEHQFQLQARPSDTLNLEASKADFPNCYRYNLQTQQIQSVTEFKPGLLSKSMLQQLMKLAQKWQARWPTDTVLSWILSEDSEDGEAADAPIQLLGPLTDLPFPMVVQGLQAPLSNPSSVAPSEHTPSSPSENLRLGTLLGTGFGVASGYVSAPVTLLDDTLRFAPATGSILVAHHIEPSHLPWLATAAGLICETGGFASHGAIMARELGCPAVVGVADILEQVQSGQWVALDGDHGRVYKAEAEHLVQPLEPLAAVPIPRPKRPTRIQVLGSISSPQRLALPELQSVDGVGIVRSEWLLLSQLAVAENTTEARSDPRRLFQRQGEQLTVIAQSVEPRPVFYRSADLDHWGWNQLGMGAKETATLDTLDRVLGVRGTLRYLEAGELFEQELMMLKTLLHQGINNLRLVLPFVRSPHEVAFCRAKMQTVGIASETELPLWIMAEVPSVLFGLAQYRGLDLAGIMIGTNDLAQLLLGIDRNHPKFQTVLAQNEPVLQGALRQLVRQASSLDLASVLCSSMPQYHTAAFLAPLMQAGLGGISVELGAVATVCTAITQAEQELGIVYDPTSIQL